MMQLCTFSLAVCATFAALAGGVAGVPSRRQIISSVHGSIAAPPDGSVIVAGSTVDFTFDSTNPCESGYEPINIYLLQEPGENTTLSSTGTFENGTYVAYLSEYLISNFGLPAMAKPPPPPSNLTMPDLASSGVIDGQTLYLAVVETYQSCPPDIPEEFGITSNAITYVSS